MLDLGSLGEILIIGTVALVLIGPKEMPIVMRRIGQWIQKLRLLSFNLRQGLDNYIQEDSITNKQTTLHSDEHSYSLSSKDIIYSEEEKSSVKSSFQKSFYTSDDRK